jgi:hypothetical protein
MNAVAGAGASEQPTQRLTDSQLREMMRLIKGAHSVELKLTVPASHHRATIQGLPGDPVEAQPRQIYFFDTPDLQLYRAGVVVRARRIAGGKGDTVVKLRPVDPEEIPTDLKNDPSFNIEVDALPGGFVCSASFKGRSTGEAIRAVVSDRKKLSKIFSKPQRAFYRLHAPMGIELDALVPLGPTFILKGKFGTRMGLDGETSRAMVAEMWLYPDGSRLLELSTKCLPGEALTVAAEARAYLIEKGVPTYGAQETKTRIALEFYSKALTAEIAEEKAEERKAARHTASKLAASKAAPAAAKAKRAAAKAKPATAKANPAVHKAKPAAAKAKPAAAANSKPAAAQVKTTTARAKPAAAKPATAKSPTARTPVGGARAATRKTAAAAGRATTRRTTTRRTSTRRTPPKSS